MEGREGVGAGLPVVLRVRVVRGSWCRTAAPSPPCHPRQGEKRLSHICPPLQFIPPPKHRDDHLQIQPRRPALAVPGDRGALAALGVRWAREGQLTPFLRGLLPVPFLPCCPEKVTRKKKGGQMTTRWQRSLPEACKREAAHPLLHPQTAPRDRARMLPCLQGRGALRDGHRPAPASLVLARPQLPVQCARWPPEARLKS